MGLLAAAAQTRPTAAVPKNSLVAGKAFVEEGAGFTSQPPGLDGGGVDGVSSAYAGTLLDKITNKAILSTVKPYFSKNS